MNDTPITRRTALVGAAWSLPVIALAVSTPLAAASTCGDVFIPSTSGSIFGVTITDTGFLVHTKPGQGNAIDVTVHANTGLEPIHVNLVTQGKNPGDNQELYTPGTTVPFVTTRRLSKASGDFLQVVDVHLTADC